MPGDAVAGRLPGLDLAAREADVGVVPRAAERRRVPGIERVQEAVEHAHRRVLRPELRPHSGSGRQPRQAQETGHRDDRAPGATPIRESAPFYGADS